MGLEPSVSFCLLRFYRNHDTGRIKAFCADAVLAPCGGRHTSEVFRLAYQIASSVIIHLLPSLAPLGYGFTVPLRQSCPQLWLPWEGIYARPLPVLFYVLDGSSLARCCGWVENRTLQGVSLALSQAIVQTSIFAPFPPIFNLSSQTS